MGIELKAGIVLIIILTLSGLIYGVYKHGYDTCMLEWEAANAAAELANSEESRSIERDASDLVNELEIEILEETAYVETEIRVIEREVIKYIESPDAGKCVVPSSGMSKINSAAKLSRAASSTCLSNDCSERAGNP